MARRAPRKGALKMASQPFLGKITRNLHQDGGADDSLARALFMEFTPQDE